MINAAIAQTIPTPPDDAKRALIHAAETIFARDGIEGASLREIAAAAGQRNHHAVQYHFGTREALVQAVFSYRMWQMEARRVVMLGDQPDEAIDLRTLIGTVFLPQIELIDAHGDYAYAAFLSQYLMRHEGRGYGNFGEDLPPALARTLMLLRAHMPAMPDTAAQRRLITACFMFLNILVIHSRGMMGQSEQLELMLDDTIGQIEAALAAPYAGDSAG